MTTFDLLRFAGRSLGANKLRSALTTLGVIFGVSSVVLMVAIGAGTHERIKEEIGRLGTNLVIVLPGAAVSNGVHLGSASNPTITEDDAVAIGSEANTVVAAAPAVRGSVHVTTGATNWSTPLLGITGDFFVARDWKVEHGRELEPEDLAKGNKVALIGRTIVDKLYEGRVPIDETIRINQLPFKVIGVLEGKGQTLSGTDLDDVIMVPLGTARDDVLGRTLGKIRSVSAIMVKVADPAHVETAIEETRAILRARHRLREDQPDDFQIRNVIETMKARKDSSTALTRLLAAVASISLLVGGIGIMNIMLVSVTERTREIGLRMAVGARPADIMAQFLTEATLLSIAGGTVGAILGVVGALVAEHQFGMRAELTVDPIAIAFAFSALVGVVFGFYPAFRASQKTPMEALRYE
jgi:putative ABC transport system permease protein